jgi:probable HAF family extracellular repeat protein
MFAMVASGGVQTAWADVVYSFSTIDVPGASPGSTSAYGINNSGQIVGDIFIGTPFGNQGFLYSDGNFTFINVPFNIRVSSVYGISSNNGQIVGTYTDFAAPHALHGFLDTAGNFTTIDVPGARLTQAYGINDNGQIVGTYQDSSGIGHSFLATPQRPPSVSCLATPNTLWPPNGKSVVVTISGTITSDTTIPAATLTP